MLEYDVANALTVAARRGRLSTELVADCAALVASLPVDLSEPAHDMTAVLDLASRHGLSAYDAAYLQLAISNDLPLATFDERLATAAHAAGVSVLGA